MQLQTAQIDNGQLIIENSERSKIPKTNRVFWVSKIRRNNERDREEQRWLAPLEECDKVIVSSCARVSGFNDATVCLVLLLHRLRHRPVRDGGFAGHNRRQQLRFVVGGWAVCDRTVDEQR